MDKVVLKQKIPFSVKVQLGIPVIALSFTLTWINFYFLPLLLITVLFIFSNYAYEINKNLNHKMWIRIFGLNIIGFKKDFIFPDYISLFNQSFKTKNAFGFLEFGESKWKEFTIKFFKDNKHIIVFKSNDKQEVLRLGKNLSVMLNVELHNTLK